MMIGVRVPVARRRLQTEKPSSPGSSTSSTMRSMARRCRIDESALPFSASNTS